MASRDDSLRKLGEQREALLREFTDLPQASMRSLTVP